MRVRLTAALVGALIVVSGGAWAETPVFQKPQGPTKVEVVNTVQTSEVQTRREPTAIERKCMGDAYDQQSDLCAQWTAAMAAAESARWTKWSFWLGLGSLVVVCGGFYQTRKNQLHEYRAYIRLQPKVAQLEVGKPVTILITHENYGRTPAMEVRSAGVGFVQGNQDPWLGQKPPAPDSTATKITVHPGTDLTAIAAVRPEPLTVRELEDFKSENIIWSMIYRTEYKDVFGKKHETQIAFRIHPTDTGGAIAFRFEGNLAT